MLIAEALLGYLEALLPYGGRLVLANEVREALLSTSASIEDSWLVDDAPLTYAFNIGVDELKNRSINADDVARFRRNLVHLHSASTGEAMPVEVFRAMTAKRYRYFCGSWGECVGHGVAAANGPHVADATKRHELKNLLFILSGLPWICIRAGVERAVMPLPQAG